MSEYWKSTPKYWCKHCSTYVKDTPFERKQHETTGKHQGNLKRFLRGIQNGHEKNERDKEKAKAEVDRLNKVVGGQAASASTMTSKPSTARKPAVGAPTAADQKRQWAQLAEMGIEVPGNFRGEMAMSGVWQTTSKSILQASAPPEDSLSVGVRKRKKEEDEEDDETGNREKRRGWGTATRRYPGQDDPDLDALLSGTVIKKEAIKTEPKQDMEDSQTLNIQYDVSSHKSDVKPETVSHEVGWSIDAEQTGRTIDGVPAKSEDVALEGPTASTDLPEEAAAPVFRKRKIKTKIA